MSRVFKRPTLCVGRSGRAAERGRSREWARGWVRSGRGGQIVSTASEHPRGVCRCAWGMRVAMRRAEEGRGTGRASLTSRCANWREAKMSVVRSGNGAARRRGAGAARVAERRVDARGKLRGSCDGRFSSSRRCSQRLTASVRPFSERGAGALGWAYHVTDNNIDPPRPASAFRHPVPSFTYRTLITRDIRLANHHCCPHLATLGLHRYHVMRLGMLVRYTERDQLALALKV